MAGCPNSKLNRLGRGLSILEENDWVRFRRFISAKVLAAWTFVSLLAATPQALHSHSRRSWVSTTSDRIGWAVAKGSARCLPLSIFPFPIPLCVPWFRISSLCQNRCAAKALHHVMHYLWNYQQSVLCQWQPFAQKWITCLACRRSKVQSLATPVSSQVESDMKECSLLRSWTATVSLCRWRMDVNLAEVQCYSICLACRNSVSSSLAPLLPLTILA